MSVWNCAARPPGPDSGDRRAETSPGRPPWAPRPRLALASVGCLGLVVVAAAAGVLSLLVAGWRLLDHASDLN